MSQSLKGQIVLITGASSGFGAHAARLFAREGAKVVLAARRLERLQQLADEIQDEGGEALAVPVDVAKRSEIMLMVQSVLDIYERIDILFNNAGFGRLDWLENLEMKRDIETQIAVNLTGLIHVSRAVLPHMIAQGSGHIINMSSVAGWTAAPLYSVYAATKFGVRGFTEALRREVRHLGVRVSGIYPGPAETEFGQHTGKNSVKGNLKSPAWLSMTSEYVAKKVVGLAKRPRRKLILPWWFGIVIWFDNHLPRISDWSQIQFAKKYHQK
ncbi:MAG: SDR family oxidoreductase [Anaerolineales bacterium]|nr:SDR family oxidoreductase [Anaerolineales bacterium]